MLKINPEINSTKQGLRDFYSKVCGIIYYNIQRRTGATFSAGITKLTL